MAQSTKATGPTFDHGCKEGDGRRARAGGFTDGARLPGTDEAMVPP